METKKKKLTENSITPEPRYIPNGMTADEFERWLLNNGFVIKNLFAKVIDPITKITISEDKGHLWVRKEKKSDDKKNIYSSDLEPSLREILQNVGQQCGTREQPVSIEAYNTFARWDVWPGGFVERFDYVDVPTTSVDYGCSIFTNSWRPRGAAENPVHVFQFYQLVNDGRWHGGDVSTWGTVSGSTKILGSSTATGFETTEEGGQTLGSIVNTGRMLGMDSYINSLYDVFSDCFDSDTGKYEISDTRLRRYLQNAFYLYYVYENNNMERVKEELLNHRAVLLRIVTREEPMGDMYGDDFVVVDYNWLRQTFVCVNPVDGKLTTVSELELGSGTPKALFYILGKD